MRPARIIGIPSEGEKRRKLMYALLHIGGRCRELMLCARNPPGIAGPAGHAGVLVWCRIDLPAHFARVQRLRGFACLF